MALAKVTIAFDLCQYPTMTMNHLNKCTIIIHNTTWSKHMMRINILNKSICLDMINLILVCKSTIEHAPSTAIRRLSLCYVRIHSQTNSLLNGYVYLTIYKNCVQTQNGSYIFTKLIANICVPYSLKESQAFPQHGNLANTSTQHHRFMGLIYASILSIMSCQESSVINYALTP